MEIQAGRGENLVTRGFVGFLLDDIPGGVTIESARLRLYQGQVIGDPFGVGGSVVVDHLDYGETLENDDYDAAVLVSSFAVLSGDSGLGWREIDVTERVRDDITASRARSEYRLHLTTEEVGGTAEGDFVYFEAGENTLSTGNTPQLVVTYQ